MAKSNDIDDLFFNNFTECPWYDGGECIGTKDTSYNGHINDRNTDMNECDYHSCPIFHWVEVLAKRLLPS